MRGKYDASTPVFLALALLIILSGILFMNYSDVNSEKQGDSYMFRTDKDLITGMVSTSLLIISSQQKICNLSITSGFNLVSLYCIPDNSSPASVFYDLGENFTSIHAYNVSNNDDPWSAYNPSLPSWVVQDLTKIRREQGYWLRVSEDSFVQINGTYSLPVFIDLDTGWNLAGYPIQYFKNASLAIAGIYSSVDQIVSYNSSDSSDPWKVYVPGSSANDLNTLTPLYGYWMNISSSVPISWRLDE